MCDVDTTGAHMWRVRCTGPSAKTWFVVSIWSICVKPVLTTQTQMYPLRRWNNHPINETHVSHSYWPRSSMNHQMLRPDSGSEGSWIILHESVSMQFSTIQSKNFSLRTINLGTKYNCRDKTLQCLVSHWFIVKLFRYYRTKITLTYYSRDN